VTAKHRCCRQPDQRDDRVRRPDRQSSYQCDKTTSGQHEDQFARSANQALRDRMAGWDRNVPQRQSQLGRRIVDCSVASCQRGIVPFFRRQQLEKLSDNVIGRQPDRFGVLAHERTAKNSGRPPRYIISLEVLEQRAFDLYRLGQRFERQTLALAMGSQQWTKSVVRIPGHRGDVLQITSQRRLTEPGTNAVAPRTATT
jgi:hypothetical protein